MPLPWVKLHVSLIDNDVFDALSRAAKLTFFYSIALAAKQDQDGALALRTGPMTSKQVARYTGLSIPQQADALKELVATGFLYMRLDGAWAIERWSDKTGDDSSARVQRLRDRKRNDDVTLQSQKSNTLDKEEDKDIDIALLRNAALAVKTWPRDIADLKDLASPFITVFSRASRPDAVKKAMPAYLEMLSIARNRGASIPDVWQACSDALAAQDGKPLFGSSAKKAISYLPSSRNGVSTAKSRGLDLSKVVD